MKKQLSLKKLIMHFVATYKSVTAETITSTLTNGGYNDTNAFGSILVLIRKGILKADGKFNRASVIELTDKGLDKMQRIYSQFDLETI